MIRRTNCQKMFIWLSLKCKISGCLPRTNLMWRITPLNVISARKFPRKITGTNPIIVHTHVVSLLLQSHQGYSTLHKRLKEFRKYLRYKWMTWSNSGVFKRIFPEQNKKVPLFPCDDTWIYKLWSERDFKRHFRYCHFSSVLKWFFDKETMLFLNHLGYKMVLLWKRLWICL